MQYFLPLYQRLAADQRVSVAIGYFTPSAATAGYADPGFGEVVRWDRPLLENYSWVDVGLASHTAGTRGVRDFFNWVRYLRGYDVVVTQGYDHRSTPAVVLAALLLRRKWLFMTDAINSSPESPHSRVSNTRVREALLRFAVKLSGGVLATSTRSTAFHRRLAGKTRSNVTLVPYVADESVFVKPSVSLRNHSRAALGFAQGTVVLGFVGKLIARKRPEDLLRAIAALPGTAALIVGAGELAEPLQELADQLGVTDRVVFTGFKNQSELPEAYAAMDVFVLPSEQEPFGLVAHEAALCGLPVISSMECGAFDDLVAPIDPKLGYRAGDTDSLIAIVRNMTEASYRLNCAERFLELATNWNADLQLEGFVDGVRS